MELTAEHKERALEIFKSFLTLNKEIKEIEEKLENLAMTHENLRERVEQIRESEQVWVKKIAEESGLSDKEVNIAIANFVMTEMKLNISL